MAAAAAAAAAEAALLAAAAVLALVVVLPPMAPPPLLVVVVVVVVVVVAVVLVVLMVAAVPLVPLLALLKTMPALRTRHQAAREARRHGAAACKAKRDSAEDPTPRLTPTLTRGVNAHAELLKRRLAEVVPHREEECGVGELLVLKGGRIPLQPELAEEHRDVSLSAIARHRPPWCLQRGPGKLARCLQRGPQALAS